MIYVKVTVGWKIWLVPEKEITPLFRSAVEKLNATDDFNVVAWRADEATEFKRVCYLPALWTDNL